MSLYLVIGILYLLGLAAVLVFFAGAEKLSKDQDAQNELLLEQLRRSRRVFSLDRARPRRSDRYRDAA